MTVRVVPGQTDLATLRPEIAAQWDTERNERRASEFNVNSQFRAWWLCARNHSFQRKIATRTSKGGTWCPFCAGSRAVPGETDLATKNPDIAAQWHPNKNSNEPSEVSAFSSKKAWWMCTKGHEWEAAISNRTSGGTRCPFCSGRRLIPGVNDLATVTPELVAQWDSSRNSLGPEEVTRSSHKKVWWLCERSHSWEAAISSRSGGTGCPVCTNKVIQVGINDLATQNPLLAAQWHPTLNDTAPTKVGTGSNKVAWWLCKLGHEWKATVERRSRGSKCPVCGGWQVLAGFNDLAARSPLIASQWHPTKNTTTPSQVGNGTPQQAWWQCEIGHEWRAAVNSRTKKGTGCPFCAGKAVLPGYNDLQTTRPDLAREWHSTRNPLTPTDFTSGSNKKVWWACSSGHEWQSTIINRSSGGYGCPICTNRTVLTGYNDLATVMPQLSSQWHPTRNTVKPTEVTIGSKKKIWWQCNEGHEWQAPVESRSSGQDCPYCSNRRVLQGFNDLATTHPHLIPEWHPDNTRSPESVTFGSDHEALWICTAHQHQWKAVVQWRSSGSSCPICSGYKVLAGFNDLTTTRPVLAAEWHPTRNTAPPTEYSAGSGTKAWWTCDKNHAWKATISNRAYGGAGCPRCNAGTSRREREVCTQIAALLKVYDYDGPRRVDRCPIPIDFVATELGIVIEYDGWYWHKEKFDSDTRKCRLLEDLGWTVVRIRERGSRQERLPLLDVPFIECGPNEPAHVVAERICVLLRSLIPTAFKEIDDAHSALSDK